MKEDLNHHSEKKEVKKANIISNLYQYIIDFKKKAISVKKERRTYGRNYIKIYNRTFHKCKGMCGNEERRSVAVEVVLDSVKSYLNLMTFR